MSQTLSGTTPLARGRATAVTIALVAALVGLGFVQAPPARANHVILKAAPAVVPWDGGITISGVGLSDTSAVTFLGNAADLTDDVAAQDFIALDDKKLVVQVPPGARTGRVEVVAAGHTFTTDAAKGDVKVVDAPSISGVSPLSGKPGDVVTVSGVNLMGSKKPKVLIGVKGAAFAALPLPSQTELTVKVPSGNAGGPATLQVITDGGTATASFYVAPEVKGVTPKAGTTAGGTVVTIGGSGFTGVDNFSDDPATPGVNERFDGVKIGGVRVTDLVAVNDKEIVAVAPARAEGLASVEVSTKDGPAGATTALGDAYDYQPIPVVTAVSQNWNNVAPEPAAPVTLTGVNFTELTKVFVGSAPGENVVADPGAGTITFTPPASPKAAVSKITVTNTSALPKDYSAVVPFGYISAPTVTKLDKVTGPVGTLVTIAGTGFGSDTEVAFGSATADCQIISFVALKCTAPSESGSVPVTVANGVDTATAVAPFAYTNDALPPTAGPAMPTIAALLPAYGTAGSTVAFKGLNLDTVTGVRFSDGSGGWVDAPNALTVGPARLVVTVPPGADTGPIRFTTANGPVTSTPKAFKYSGKPNIAKIDVVGEATYGATAGDMLKITGTGLFPAGVRPVVTIGGKAAPVLPRPAPTQKTIVVRVPASVGGREPVVLTTPLGSDTAETTLYFVPQVKGAKPATPADGGGTVVTIAGSGFNGVENVTGREPAVQFGGVPVARYVKMSDKMIVAVTAPGSASADDLLVKTLYDGRVGLSNDTVRYAAPPQPTLASVSPDSAPTGPVPPAVTITGTNLHLDPVVRFGGVGGVVQSVASDGTSMTVIPPASTNVGAVGITVVTTVDGDDLTDSLPGAYTYVASPATVTGLSASTAAPGTPVAITGTNFNGVSSVKFGTVEVSSFTVGNANTIFTTVPLTPAGAAGGAVDVTVTNSSGTPSTGDPSSADNWTWNATPVVTGMSSATGNEASTVTITGRGFTGATAVNFGSVPATAYNVVSDTSITATVPVTPSAGATADVSVVGANGLSQPPLVATANDWTWAARPIITSMSANSGAENNVITVTGQNLSGIRSVTVDIGTPLAAKSFTPINATSFSFVVPARPGQTLRANRPVIVINGSGAPSSANPAGANLFTWL